MPRPRGPDDVGRGRIRGGRGVRRRRGLTWSHWLRVTARQPTPERGRAPSAQHGRRRIPAVGRLAVVNCALIVVAAMTTLAVVGVGGVRGCSSTRPPAPTSTMRPLLPTPTASSTRQRLLAVDVRRRHRTSSSSARDARPGDTRRRSDVIILVHIPQDATKVYLIHFPRDLYVTDPGPRQGQDQRGLRLRRRAPARPTMQGMLGIHIDHVAKTDFAGFQAMTDAVGGVRVYAEEASTGTGNGGPVVIHNGLERPQRRQGAGLRPGAVPAQRGGHLPRPPRARLPQGAPAQGDERVDADQPDCHRSFVDAATQGPRRRQGFTMST